MSGNYTDDAKVFKAFCDENRLRIIELLQKGEKCACTLQEELPISQSTLSHHMKILVDSGVVIVRKDKKWSYYSISDIGANYSIDLLKSLLTKNYDKQISFSCNKE